MHMKKTCPGSQYGLLWTTGEKIKEVLIADVMHAVLINTRDTSCEAKM